MKTSGEIISYLESELSEAYKQCDHWKDIDHSESMKYRIRANMLEDVLYEIDPPGEREEEIAKVLVDDPGEKKPKRTLLKIYVNVFFLFVFFASLIAVSRSISGLLETLNITGLAYSLLLYGFYLLHTVSTVLMFVHKDMIFTTEKVYKGEK